MPRVLVVDDDPDARWMAAAALGDAYEVLAAASPAEALARARETPPDAAVVDLGFAGEEDGWELVRGFQTDPALCRVPVVVLSARPALQGEAARGCAAYLRKPCHMAELRAVLERLLGPISG